MIKPLSYRVLIKDEVIENKTAGGIILDSGTTDSRQTGTVYGEIVDAGSVAFKPRQVEWKEGQAHAVVDDFAGVYPKIGDRVLYIRNAGSRFVKVGEELRPIDEDYKDGGELYRLLNDVDITAIAPKEDA